MPAASGTLPFQRAPCGSAGLGPRVLIGRAAHPGGPLAARGKEAT